MRGRRTTLQGVLSLTVGLLRVALSFSRLDHALLFDYATAKRST